MTTPKRPKPKPERPALASTHRPPNHVRLEYGDRVHHPAYGPGDVVATEPDRGRATIHFEADHSTRTFVVVRSPLKLVSRQDHRTR